MTPVREVRQPAKSDVWRGYLVSLAIRAAIALTLAVLAWRAAALMVDQRDDILLLAAWALYLGLLVFAIWTPFALWRGFKAFARRLQAARPG